MIAPGRPRSLFGFVLASTLAGCAGGMTFIMQDYDGPPRPRSTVAMIRTDDRGPMLTAVDGKAVRVASALDPGNRLHVEVLPGPHQVDVEVAEVETGLVHRVPIRFVAEADKVYRVEVRAFQAPGSPTFLADAYEVDRDSDARLGPVAPAVPVSGAIAPGSPASPPLAPPADDPAPAPTTLPPP